MSVMPRFHVIACALLLLAMMAAAPSHGAKVYRWTDRNGVVHYGDRVDKDAPPDADVAVLPVRVEPRAIARLRIEDADGRHLAWAENLLDGPIEVMLHAEDDGVVGEPALPARATVPAHSRTLVAYVAAAQPGRRQLFRLGLEAVPGDPNARPRDIEYGYPLRTDTQRIEQGWGGSFSHTDAENRHAVDFAVPVGTPVVAAREGVVMQFESDFDETGLDAKRDSGRANYVRILHDDGSMAIYAHLAPEGTQVRPGQRVRRGERIGLSGNTGYSGGPHLHFVVQVNRGMRLESIPFRMFGPRGILRFDDHR